MVVVGTVPDVLPYLQQATTSVVPLHAGPSTRLKILEAMAAGRGACIADDPRSFADTICALLADPDRRANIVWHAQALVERRYNWDVVVDGLVKDYEALVAYKRLES